MASFMRGKESFLFSQRASPGEEVERFNFKKSIFLVILKRSLLKIKNIIQSKVFNTPKSSCQAL